MQYPGAAKALRSDLRQVARLGRAVRVIAPAVDVEGIIEELQDRVVEELDYRREAESQSIFAEEFADDPEIVVPSVVAHTEQRSSPRGWRATTRWPRSSPTAPRRSATTTASLRALPVRRPGAHRTAARRPAPRQLPDHAGRSARRRRLRRGRLVCPTACPPSSVACCGPPSTAIRGRHRRAARAWVPAAQRQSRLRDHRALRGPFAEPASAEEFTFSREWMRGQITRVSAPTADGIGTSLRINLPREYVLLHRVWAGGVGVLSQLGATAHFRSSSRSPCPASPTTKRSGVDEREHLARRSARSWLAPTPGTAASRRDPTARSRRSPQAWRR